MITVMQLRLLKPELAKFVADKVEAGAFPSAEAVVEDALARMIAEETFLSDDDVAAINESEDQIDRGELVEFDAFAAEMRRKYCGGK